MQIVFLSLALMLAFALGAAVVFYLNPSRGALAEQQQRNELLDAELSELRATHTNTLSECARLAQKSADFDTLVEAKAEQERRITALTADKARLEEKIHQQAEERAQMREESERNFKELAAAILEEKSQNFKRANEERLGEILAPFKDNLEGLQKKIQECYTGEVSEVKSLRDSLQQLADLNKSISTQAHELTVALRGNTKVQGDWGEMILKRILEESGLEEGTNFVMQATTNADGSKIVSEDGHDQRPDALFFLPEGKCIIIDSKVSLTAYTNYVNAATEQERNAALAEHLKSVKSHVSELADKTYQRSVKNSADFVMMFVPNEGAYMAAMNGDTNLWQWAYNKHIVIISPTHLISVLKLMYQLWTRDKQTKNAIEIAEEAGKMYDKLCGFMTDFESINTSLESARKQYNEAKKKLSTGNGNVLKKAKDIRDLGAKTTKELPNLGGE